MINFSEGWSPNNNLRMSKEQIKKLVESIMNKNPYSEGSFHGGLGLAQIKEIISYLMYTENNNLIKITIDKEFDEYHLSLTIDEKEK